MKIGVLSRKPRLYSIRRLMEAKALKNLRGMLQKSRKKQPQQTPISVAARLVLALLLTLGLPPAASQALVILQYHHISDDTPASTSTSPALFREHLEIIEASRFEIVALETVTELARRGAELPDRAVLITFDDSYSSIYDTAYPLLKARGWPFAVFANTQPVDDGQRGFMTWEQLREMAENGAAIANHSVDHPHMVRRDVNTDLKAWRAGIEREILHAETRIQTLTGQGHKVLAFPYGEYDAELLDLLNTLGFLGMSQASGAVRKQDGLAMPRFPMGGSYGRAADFKLKLNALPMPAQAVTLNAEDGRRLEDGLLPADVTRPVLELALYQPGLVAGLQCYATGQIEPISKTAGKNSASFQADRPLPAGRSRYNCTVRDPASGRYHWFSQPFLRPRDDGSWPAEP